MQTKQKSMWLLRPLTFLLSIEQLDSQKYIKTDQIMVGVL
jgi:hypothetical protein